LLFVNSLPSLNPPLPTQLKNTSAQKFLKPNLLLMHTNTNFTANGK
jgi:hypothetical protein